MEKDMQLPKDKKVKDCIFFKKCSRLFGCKENNIECDFAPSRFIEKTNFNQENDNNG